LFSITCLSFLPSGVHRFFFGSVNLADLDVAFQKTEKAIFQQGLCRVLFDQSYQTFVRVATHK